MEYELLEFVRDWNQKWFYMYNHPPALSKHTRFAPRKKSQWLEKLTATEHAKILPFIKQIDTLKMSRVTGEIVVKSFITRWIQPMAQRVNFGFEYLEAIDLTRTTPEALPSKQVLILMRELLKGTNQIPKDVMWPFSAS